MEDLPRVVIIPTATSLHWEKIIRGIMSSNSLPESAPVSSSALLYQLECLVCNRYYTAPVELCVVDKHWSDQAEIVTRDCEALIIYWDNTLPNPIDVLDEIISKLPEGLPDVCLLVCDGFKDVKASRHGSNQWCVKQQFELVELESDPEEEEEEDSDFPESRGVDRLQGALHANCWSSRVPSINTADLTKSITVSPKKEDKPFADSLLPHCTDPTMGSVTTATGSLPRPAEPEFEELFARFEDMRLTASSLTSRKEKLDYAERVALAFLEAVGDEDFPAGEVEAQLLAGRAECSPLDSEEDDGSQEVPFQPLVDGDCFPQAALSIEEQLGFPLLDG